jgi:serine/threonine protein kinase
LSLFEQEISISFYLGDHPNIAKFLGFSKDPKTLLQRYYPLGTLWNLIQRPLSVGMDFQWTSVHRKAFALDIAKGLAYMHSMAIAYCDLKPHNVLISEENGKLTAVLTDFGISLIMDVKLSSGQAPIIDHLNGITVRYAAPEAIRRLLNRPYIRVTPVMARAGDVYSFAAVIYAMLCMKMPWWGEDVNK